MVVVLTYDPLNTNSERPAQSQSSDSLVLSNTLSHSSDHTLSGNRFWRPASMRRRSMTLVLSVTFQKTNSEKLCRVKDIRPCTLLRVRQTKGFWRDYRARWKPTVQVVKRINPGYLRRFPYDDSHYHIQPLWLNVVPIWWLQISDCEPEQHRFTGYFMYKSGASSSRS